MSELQEDLDRFEKIANKLMESQQGQGNTNTQTTTIDAGSKALWFAVWLATTCCIVMFIMGQNDRDKLSNMQIQLTDTSRKLDVAQDKLSIVLQWAPNLRDEVNKEMKEKAH